jgi:alpha-L-rhamnosidase
MVRPGPNSVGATWENIKPDGSIEKGSTSLAHGWSSAPTSALTRYVLGARPVDAGYATWIVQPQPGSLSWTVGQVPTPHGPLAVNWGRASGDEFDAGEAWSVAQRPTYRVADVSPTRVAGAS